MKQLNRRESILASVHLVSRHAQLAFAAAIAERLLPNAKAPLTVWRPDAWQVHRRALDAVWDYLDGSKLPEQNYVALREKCLEQIPDDEDPDWQGGIGAFEAGAAVVHTLDSLISSDPEDAVRVSDQAFDALRIFLVSRMFPSARTHRDINEDSIFNSDVMQNEINMENRQLERLKEFDTDDHDFAAELNTIKEHSKQNPIILTAK